MRLIRDASPERPVADLALSHALLLQVARGDAAPAVRMYRPGATLAFGRLDARRPGFGEAVRAARHHGFEPVLRVCGGRAAAYDGGSLIYEEVSASPRITQGLAERFRDASQLIAAALTGLGLDARVGALAGEYCPGQFSVNVGGRIKVAGSAQRVIRGAALLSVVVVVSGGERIRSALVDVYEALELDWTPSTAGAADDCAPALALDVVERAILSARLAPVPQVEPVSEQTRALARTLEARHEIT